MNFHTFRRTERRKLSSSDARAVLNTIVVPRSNICHSCNELQNTLQIIFIFDMDSWALRIFSEKDPSVLRPDKAKSMVLFKFQICDKE
jgi:hypothetical protein